MKNATKKDKLIMIALILYSSLGMLSSSMSTVVQKVIEVFPDMPVSTVRLVSTMPSIASMLIGLIVGPIIGKKLRYKTLMILGCLLLGIGGIMPAYLNQTFSIILVARFINGLGMGMIGCNNTICLGCFEGSLRTWILGICVVAQNVGNIIWTQLAGFLGDINWKYSSFVSFGAFIVMIYIILFFKEPEQITEHAETKQSDTTSEKTSLRIAFRGKIYLYYFLSFLTLFWGYPLIIGMSTFISARGLGAATLTGTMLSCYGVGGMIGGAMFKTFNRVFKRYLYSFLGTCAAVGCICILISNNVVLCAFGMILCGIGIYTMFPAHYMYVGIQSPVRYVGLMSTLILVVTQIAGFFANYWINLSDIICPFFSTDIENAFLTMAVGWGIVALILIVYDPRPKSMQLSN